MVEFFAKVKKEFGDSLKSPSFGSDSLHKQYDDVSTLKTVFMENMRNFQPRKYLLPDITFAVKEYSLLQMVC